MSTNALPAPTRARSFPTTTVFLLLWVPMGFTIGTLILIGPVRWWADTCRRLDIAPRIENAGVLFLILILIMLSGYLARIAANVMEDSPRHIIRLGIPAIVLAAAGAATAAWLHPAMMTGTMAEEVEGTRFRFGPYPDELRMRALKRQGYTIVTLLHPAVVPFEPKLLHDEKKRAKKIGVQLIHVPMLPWISENTTAIATIKRLAADPSRRYYVHCYLGKDRVQVVRRAVEQSGVKVHSETRRRHRSIMEKGKFERGDIYQLGAHIYVTGYPTDEEFMHYVLSGQVQQVVALLDPNDPRERGYIERERLLMGQHDMPFEVIPADDAAYHAGRALEAVRRVKQLPKPVLVHAFLSPSTGRSKWGDGFIQAFHSDRPSLPPSLFDAPLRDGATEVVVAHVAIGPRPAPPEFRELTRRGVVEFIHVGSDPDEDDARRAGRAGARWSTSPRVKIIDAVRGGGPYYVYGSDAALLRDVLQREYPKPHVIH